MREQLLPTFSDLSTLTSHQIKAAFGGKALGLFEAYSQKIPIPETWVLSSEHFLKFSNLHAKKKDFAKQAENYLKEHFSKAFASLPSTLFAVRSSTTEEDSAEHSFAGIFESKLDVPRPKLFEAIAYVWDSCHSLRAGTYIKGADVAMGVIIQPMIKAKYAGVCFSKHPSPSTVFENQDVVIEFAETRGDKMMQGEITPFRLSGTMDSISQVSDAPWIDELLKCVIALKNFHHHEIDIEFVIDATETFYLVQQRPVQRAAPSSLLDLSHYERKYKRPLLNLDVELLIDGCSQFLAPYLEVPYQMERWMVMVQSPDGNQELWVHKLLNDAVTSRIAEKIEQDDSYLERMQARYFSHYNAILENDYRRFFKPILPLERRFFHFCEWITPLCAHYYVPIFMIDALYLVLKPAMERIDPKNAENDLFFLETSGISTLMDLCLEELRALKAQVGDVSNFETLKPDLSLKLDVLRNKYGFLKCREHDEEGYTARDLFLLMKGLVPKEPIDQTKERESLIQKYFPDPKMQSVIAEFRSWTRIRNQEMEYLMYAFYCARPLFTEIAEAFNLPLRIIWKSSKEKILGAIEHKDPKFINIGLGDHLSIFRSFGKTRMIDSLKVVRKASSP